MPQTIINDEGEEIEVSTPEEVEAAKVEAVEVLTKQKDEELATLKAELEKEQAKEKNFKNLREKKEKGDEEKKTIEQKYEELQTQMNDNFSSISNTLKEKDIDLQIKNLSSGNHEVSEKIKFYYKQFQEPKENEEDTRLTNAFSLATGSSQKDILGGVATTGKSAFPTGGTGNKLSETAKAAAESLGITQEDIKKYGNKI